MKNNSIKGGDLSRVAPTTSESDGGYLDAHTSTEWKTTTLSNYVLTGLFAALCATGLTSCINSSSYDNTIELNRYSNGDIYIDTSFDFLHKADDEEYPVSIHYNWGKPIIKIKTKDGWKRMPENENPQVRIERTIKDIQWPFIDSWAHDATDYKSSRIFHLKQILDDMPEIKILEYSRDDDRERCKITVKFSDIRKINFSNLMKELEKVIPKWCAVDLEIK